MLNEWVFPTIDHSGLNKFVFVFFLSLGTLQTYSRQVQHDRLRNSENKLHTGTYIFGKMSGISIISVDLFLSKMYVVGLISQLVIITVRCYKVI